MCCPCLITSMLFPIQIFHLLILLEYTQPIYKNGVEMKTSLNFSAIFYGSHLSLPCYYAQKEKKITRSKYRFFYLFTRKNWSTIQKETPLLSGNMNEKMMITRGLQPT